MATINVFVPDTLRQRMDDAGEVDWSAIAQQAFDGYLAQMAARTTSNGELSAASDRLHASKAAYEERERNAGYAFGYAWAKHRAQFRDLQTVVDAPDYPSAADVVRTTRGFSQRDEFGDTTFPSDEMWEGFVDGATALYNDVIDKI